jgi:DNA-binding GntR family transcriptional regulator
MISSNHLRNRRVSTKDFAYVEIKQKIINGELEPDQTVVEESLASELEISRTPLREALQRLEIEELVIRQANGRLKVAPISAQEVEEIFVVRSLLEGITAREATMKADKKEIEHLEKLTREIVEAAREGKSENVIYYGSQFHSYLYEISGNRTVLKILGQLNDHISRYRRWGPLRKQDRSRAAAEEHQMIFDRIAAKDAEGAQMEMRKHIQNSLATAVESIEVYLRERKQEEEN